MDALAAARAEPECETVFLGIGFETTAPALAAALRRARADGLSNLSLLPMGKLVPPALRAILADGRAKVDGLLLPGHVSAILGVAPYEFIPREFRVPCVITGFEPVDILDGIRRLLEQEAEGRAEVEIGYRRAVSPQGNPTARALMAEVFTPCDAEWRALGVIPASGLALSPAYASADAARKFPVEVPEAKGDPGCRCGEILTGRAQPYDCALFGKSCTPDEPVGPCMVSSEGACAAHFKYGEH
jgi:hydrogenase expression/formation protein HypD